MLLSNSPSQKEHQLLSSCWRHCWPHSCQGSNWSGSTCHHESGACFLQHDDQNLTFKINLGYVVECMQRICICINVYSIICNEQIIIKYKNKQCTCMHVYIYIYYCLYIIRCSHIFRFICMHANRLYDHIFTWSHRYSLIYNCVELFICMSGCI